MNLKLARQRVADLEASLTKAKRDRAAIPEAAMREKRAMTEDERTKFVEALKPIETLESELAEAKDVRTAAEDANEAERHYVGPTLDPDADAAAASAQAAGVTRVEVGRDRTTEAPGYWGRQLLAIRKIALHVKGLAVEPVTSADMALVKPMQAAPTGLNTDVPSEGGYIVMPQRSNTILQRAYEVGQVLSRVARMPIGAGSNGMQIPAIDETSRADSSRYGGIVSTWVGQGTSVTSGKPKFRIMDLKLRKCMATVYATDEQLNDAVALEGWINRYLPLELQFRAEDAVLNGLGSNQPLGVMQSGAVITYTRSQASRILSDDLRSMVNRMWAPLWSRAAFFVDQSTLGEFDLLAVPVGTGGQLDPSYKAAGSVPGQVFATYKNIPIIPVEYCAALGTSGDIILVNLDEYIVIDKGGVDQAVSIHVAFLTDEQVFRFIYRVDGQLSWNAALTPKSGGSTLSCAVILS